MLFFEMLVLFVFVVHKLTTLECKLLSTPVMFTCHLVFVIIGHILQNSGMSVLSQIVVRDVNCIFGINCSDKLT